MQGHRGLSFEGHAARKGPPGHVIGQGSPQYYQGKAGEPGDQSSTLSACSS